MKKRITTTLLAGAMILSVAGCGQSSSSSDNTTAAATTAAAAANNDAAATTAAAANNDAAASSDSTEQGKVLNVYCWNDEFQSRYNAYAADLAEAAGVTVNWIINTNEGGVYQSALDTALANQDSAAADEKVDIFLIEADYALKYTASPYCMSVSELGITADEMKDQYKYTQEIVTANGEIKGLTWQATPGLFAYRRSIAKEVLGTDDPNEVQTYLSDWSKFDETAAKMKDAGYFMLAGYDDSYRTFSNNVSSPWVVDNKIVIDDNIMRWVDQTKTYTDNGYNNKTSLWSAEWAKEQGPEGKTFGFFYSTWGINFTLLGNSLETSIDDGGVAEVGNGIYGDYAVCEGPEAYYWGGTWICAAKGTDNAPLIADIMRRLTCDKDTMKQITIDTQDYTNNAAAMQEIADDPNFGSDFLGGQNHIALFVAAAPNIDCSNISAYDQLMNEKFQGAMKDYFTGAVDKQQALDKFYNDILDAYPELSK